MSRVWPVRHEDRAAAYRASGAWHGRTIADDAHALAADDPDGELFLGEPAPVTAATLIAEAEALVVGLADLGIGKGDVVSFMIPNWVEGAAINLAAAMAGLVVNPIVPIYREAETRMILRDCGARAVFIPTVFRRFDHAAMLASLRADLPDLAHVVTLRGTADGALAYADLVAAGRGRRPALPKVDPGSVKMIMYTSGTTGRPKGVLHSHETLARAVAASTDYWGVRPGDTVLMPSPVTHVSGYSNGLERPFLGRTRTVLMENWNAAEAVALIDRHHVALTVAATPFLQELIGAAAAAGSSIPSFRLFACGGAAVPADTIRRANAAFALPCAFRVYGSSEAPFVSLGFVGADTGELAATTDGRIVDYDVRILDEAGAPLPPGAKGEIVVRGPALFLGYAEAPQTAEAFTPDGYFRTGDIGRLTEQDGLEITGRKKDLIIRGGENISAREIEDALHRVPGIVEAAVVAMPHDRLGEGVCAFVIAAPGAAPTVAGIAAALADSGLARQKLPERVEIAADLPRTASGKVRKDMLRADIARMVAGEKRAE